MTGSLPNPQSSTHSRCATLCHAASCLCSEASLASLTTYPIGEANRSKGSARDVLAQLLLA